ncbi:MAG: PorV/PorQ family protein [Candidatus Margulisbacteria bacterium]|jgi:hypothetical protein|nr:PorV/PorQ family protein [Candidatus Margulisiibacteriota bacterium]
MRRIFLTLGLALLTFTLTAATYGPGTTAANYLKIGLGAKAAALGENFTAGADDSSAVYWNTAGLGSVRAARVDFMQLNWLAGISAKTVFGAYPLSDKDTLGAYMLMLDTPQDKEMVYISSDENGGGGTDGTETGSKFKSAISVLNLGYSRIISRKLDAGLGLKVINEDLAGDQATGLALDAGIIYKDLLPSLKLGLTVQNIGLKALRPDEEFPLTLAGGAEYSLLLWRNKLNLLADVRLPNDNAPRLGLGVEYWLGNILAGRVGYNTFSQLSLGLGLSFAGLAADYAYVPMGELGVTHRISVGYSFDALQRTARPAEAAAEKIQFNESQQPEPFAALTEIPQGAGSNSADVLSQFDF